MTDSIAEWLERERATSARVVGQWLKTQRTEGAALGLPMQAMMKYLTNYCLRGGKWHRPALTRLVFLLLGVRINPKLMQASVINELTHRYLLAHDDIIDQDLVRHHGPTLEAVYRQRFERKFGGLTETTYALGMGMVGGDLLNASLHQWIVDIGLPDKTALAFIDGLNQMLTETIAGWLLETDLKYTPLREVKTEQVNQAMLLVSAHYSVLWPLRLGQILAGRVMGDWIAELEIYGREVGLAFQLIDDVLGIFGDEALTGKPVGNDLREGKKSWLLVTAYQAAKPAEKAILSQALLRPAEPAVLAEVRRIIENTGALDQTRNLALIRAKAGIKAIENIKTPAEEVKSRLKHLAEFLAKRQF